MTCYNDSISEIAIYLHYNCKTELFDVAHIQLHHLKEHKINDYNGTLANRGPELETAPLITSGYFERAHAASDPA